MFVTSVHVLYSSTTILKPQATHSLCIFLTFFLFLRRRLPI